MTSLYDLIKVLIVLYLGFFSYILYQILFYRQRRFLFLKTILFFFILAIIIIKVANHYSIPIFHIYILIYLLGLYIAKKLLAVSLKKYNKALDMLIAPLKKHLIKLFKIISIPPFVYFLKKKIGLYRYYKKHPNKRPKSIYELF